MKSKKMIMTVALLLSLVVNILNVPKVLATGSHFCYVTVNVKVQKLVNGEKPKPGEVFEFEISPDSDDRRYFDFDETRVKTDENGEAVFTINSEFDTMITLPYILGDWSYTIKEINVPEGYTAMNDAHFELHATVDREPEIGIIDGYYVNDEYWLNPAFNWEVCEGQEFTFEATPNTINNVKDEETPVDPREETPTTEIKPPESGTLTRSFIAVAAILVLGFTIYRLSHRKSGKE